MQYKLLTVRTKASVCFSVLAIPVHGLQAKWNDQKNSHFRSAEIIKGSKLKSIRDISADPGDSAV